MTTFVADNGHDGYAAVVAAVMSIGEERAPRGLKTRDLGFTEVVFPNPHQMLPLGTRPGLSSQLAALEAVQLVGGFSDPDLVEFVAPSMMKFAESDKTFWGAYGVRISDQVRSVVNKLKKDPDSRQSVITLWDPSLDNQPEKRDYPCTVSFVFEIVNNKLCMTTFMRSNDVFRGFPYDLYQFSQLHHTVANALTLFTGTYRHLAVSMHAYETDFEALDQVSLANARAGEFQPLGFGTSLDSWDFCRERAQMCAYADLWDPEAFTPDELWHAVRLRYPNDKTKWVLH